MFGLIKIFPRKTRQNEINRKIVAIIYRKSIFLRLECNYKWMEKEQKIREWILDLPKRGKITFSLDEA